MKDKQGIKELIIDHNRVVWEILRNPKIPNFT